MGPSRVRSATQTEMRGSGVATRPPLRPRGLVPGPPPGPGPTCFTRRLPAPRPETGNREEEPLLSAPSLGGRREDGREVTRTRQ